MSELSDEDRENMRLDLELKKQAIMQRDQRLYLADSIIVSISLLVILGCFQYRRTLLLTKIFVSVGAILLFGILRARRKHLDLVFFINKILQRLMRHELP